jgi:putative hydrolase of the HAD superfamily
MAAVVFDLDDTLYPHVRYVYSGFSAVARHLAQRFGVDANDAYTSLRRAFDVGFDGREFQRICDVYGLDVSIVPELVTVMRTHTPDLRVSYDVLDTLQGLRRQGWSLAILTNGLPQAQAAKVRALGLGTLVDHVVYADDYAAGGKPAPEPFLETLRRLRAAPHQAVMVGNDHLNDIEGARAIGMRTILLARGARPSVTGGADVVVSDLSGIARIALDLVNRAVPHAA